MQEIQHSPLSLTREVGDNHDVANVEVNPDIFESVASPRDIRSISSRIPR